MSKPIKQFYNRKTGKWHVYYPNPKQGKPAQIIKEVRSEKLKHVPVVGGGKPSLGVTQKEREKSKDVDFTLLADSLYKQPASNPEDNETDIEIEAVTGNPQALEDDASSTAKIDKPEDDENKEDDKELGFFNFL